MAFALDVSLGSAQAELVQRLLPIWCVATNSPACNTAFACIAACVHPCHSRRLALKSLQTVHEESPSLENAVPDLVP